MTECVNNTPKKKQIIKICLALFLAIMLGYIIRACIPDRTTAVVSVKQVINQSLEVSRIRQDNEKKLNELSSWLDNAKKEIENERNRYKREELTRQYQDTGKQKENIIKQEYKQHLKEIDIKITNTIKQVAKEHHCKMILDKSSVVDGGVDITEFVIKRLNNEE